MEPCLGLKLNVVIIAGLVTSGESCTRLRTSKELQGLCVVTLPLNPNGDVATHFSFGSRATPSSVDLGKRVAASGLFWALAGPVIPGGEMTAIARRRETIGNCV